MEILSRLVLTSAVSLVPCDGAADTIAKRWMDTWLSRSDRRMARGKRDPGEPLQISRFKDPMYFLLRSIKWRPNPGQEKYQPVEVPTGFVTDFASIPRVFWSLLRPDGDYAYAAVIHDHLYWTQTRTREESDEIFKFAMEDFRVHSTAIKTIYSTVRLAGWAPWKQNWQLREKGEKRVLRKFPADPRITWANWKRRADVFEV